MVPKLFNQPSSALLPAPEVGNCFTLNRPPIPSSAAATFTSRWVSTPPVTGRELSTIVNAIPTFHCSVRGGSAASCGTVDRPVGAGRSATLIRTDHHPGAGRQIVLKTSQPTVSRLWSQTRPRRTERNPPPQHQLVDDPEQLHLHPLCRIGRGVMGEIRRASVRPEPAIAVPSRSRWNVSPTRGAVTKARSS
jgi:hypothetical protein